MADPDIGGSMAGEMGHERAKGHEKESDRAKAKWYKEEYDKAKAYVKDASGRIHELQNAMTQKDIRIRDLELGQRPSLEDAYTANLKQKDLEIEKFKQALAGKDKMIRELSENIQRHSVEIASWSERIAKYKEKLSLARTLSEQKSKALHIIQSMLTLDQWNAVAEAYREGERGDGEGQEI